MHSIRAQQGQTSHRPRRRTTRRSIREHDGPRSEFHSPGHRDPCSCATARSRIDRRTRMSFKRTGGIRPAAWYLLLIRPLKGYACTAAILQWDRSLKKACATVAQPNGVLLFLDADETLSANVLKASEWKSFLDAPPGTLGRFWWVQLWKSPLQYISSGRGVGWDDPRRVFQFSEVVCLHFAWVFYQRAVRRQNSYKASYVVRGAKSHHHNNRNHSWHRRVRAQDLSQTPGAWLDRFRVQRVDPYLVRV